LIDANEFEESLTIDVLGFFQLTRKCLRPLLAAKGNIVAVVTMAHLAHDLPRLAVSRT
jgi:NAD(P)-dependent dehydrogenase (short-subunit alcohol dehydrogenase family)